MSRAARGWLFLLPLLALNAIVVAGPSVATLYYSFTDWSGLGPAEWIGFGNYTRAFTDPQVREALLHNGVWFVLFLTVPSAMGLLGAYLLARIKRFQTTFRVLYFIPYVVASVVNAAVWKMLLSPTSGLTHQLGEWGVPGVKDIAWLGDTNTSLLSVNFVVNWHWWGFLAVIFFAAMQSVDQSLYDAAKVDGASEWQQFRNVTIPGIRPTLLFLSLMTLIWTLKAFDYIFIMTQGGPAGSSEVVSTLMYKQAFNEYEAGYAAALGMSMTVVTALVLVVYQLLRRRGWEE
jgi:raffinose/stachyose/melibiose transport system permease protein